MHSALITYAGGEAISCVERQKGKKSKQRVICGAGMQYKIPLPRKSVRLAFLVMTHKAWWEKNFVPNGACVCVCVCT